MKKTSYCSFCGKSQHEVRHLIAGPAAFICNGCIDECLYLMVKEDNDDHQVRHQNFGRPS